MQEFEWVCIGDGCRNHREWVCKGVGSRNRREWVWKGWVCGSRQWRLQNRQEWVRIGVGCRNRHEWVRKGWGCSYRWRLLQIGDGFLQIGDRFLQTGDRFLQTVANGFEKVGVVLISDGFLQIGDGFFNSVTVSSNWRWISSNHRNRSWSVAGVWIVAIGSWSVTRELKRCDHKLKRCRRLRWGWIGDGDGVFREDNGDGYGEKWFARIV